MIFNGGKFWDYYTTATNGRNSEYRNAFGNALYQAGVSSYTSASYVKSNLAPICKSAKIQMMTAKVPKGVADSILLQFKKWVNSTY